MSTPIKQNPGTMRSDARTEKPVIVWEGSQFINHSLAIVNREICKRLLDSENIELQIVEYETDPNFPITEEWAALKRQAVSVNKSADITVRHQWPPKFVSPGQGKWVLIQPWEFGAIPRQWFIPMKYWIDEIWVHSNYNKESYVRSGIPADKIKVIAHGVDTAKFHPSVPTYDLPTSKAFKFLFVGGTIPRKGADLLIDAYVNEFTRDDDVCLVIKDFGTNSFYKGQTMQAYIHQLQQEKNNPEILYLNDELSTDDLASLYKTCDCLVHPYRGEGFGMPLIEAMACGTPVMVPDMGPSADFCSEETSFLVPAEEIRLDQQAIGELKTVDLPWLIQVDTAMLRERMRDVSRHPEAAKAKGEKAAAFIAKHYTWEKSAALYLDFIQQLQAKPAVAIPDNSKIIEQEMKRAKQFYQQRKWDEALNIYGFLQENYPNDLDPYYNAAVVFFQRNDIASAHEALQKIVRLMSNEKREYQSEIYNLIGVCHAKTKQYDDAIAMFNRALQLTPSYKQAKDNRQMVERERKKNPGKVGTEVQVKQQQPLLSDKEISLEMLDAQATDSMDNLDYDSALELSKQIFQQMPHDTKNLYRMALLLFIKKQFALSVQCLQAGIKELERFSPVPAAIPEFYNLLGASYYEMNNLLKAQEIFWNMVERFPQFADSRSNLDEATAAIEKYKKDLSLRKHKKNILSEQEFASSVIRQLSRINANTSPRVDDLLIYLNKGDKILYFGRSSPGIIHALTERDVQVNGMELSDEMFVEGTYRAGIEQLLAVGESYDAIIFDRLLEAMEFAQCMKYVYEASQRLNEQGKMIVVTGNVENPQGSASFWSNPANVRPYPPLLVEKILENLQFMITNHVETENQSEVFVVGQRDVLEIKWASPVFNTSGYAEEQKDFLDTLAPLRVKIELTPTEDQQKPHLLRSSVRRYMYGLQKNKLQQTSIHYQAGPGYQFQLPEAPISIGRTMFETDRVPEAWVPKMNELTEIWVPSQFNRETFIASGVKEDKIIVMPAAVDERRYDLEHITPLEIPGLRAFLFLSVFDWSLRKGWDLLLRAYMEEFTQDEDVTLVLKINKFLYPDVNPQNVIDYLANQLGVKRIPHIKVLDAFMDEEEMLSLYKTAHSFVLPSRGEGWGRPYMEAMAMGLPTIGTRWSGNMAFMNNDNSYLIDLERLVPVDNSMPSFYHGHKWAQPSCEHLKMLMRHVFEHREEAKEKGSAARSFVLDNFSKRVIGSKVAGRMEELVAIHFG